MAERLDEIEEAAFPTTTTELLETLRASDINWNSCGIERDRILDGWRQAITTTFDGSTGIWTFRSAGKDAKMRTKDDIKKATKGKIRRTIWRTEPRLPSELK